MGDFYLGGIILFGGAFAPRDFTFCNGQLMPISQSQALYAILGTTWGGDGRTNFAVPDLRGRVPAGVGAGPGLMDMPLSIQLGTNTYQLTERELPVHSHPASFTGTGGGGAVPISAVATVNAQSGLGNEEKAEGNYWASTGSSFALTPGAYSNTANATMAPDAVTVTVTGGGGGITGGTVTVDQAGLQQPLSIMQPTLGIFYLMAIDGTFPARN